MQEHHAKSILSISVLNSSSLVRACISAGSVFHVVGAKFRKLFYLKLIWLDFGISRSKGFLYWCCEGLSVIRSFIYFGFSPFFILWISMQMFTSLLGWSIWRLYLGYLGSVIARQIYVYKWRHMLKTVHDMKYFSDHAMINIA